VQRVSTQSFKAGNKDHQAVPLAIYVNAQF
jgi:hypothetical protein